MPFNVHKVDGGYKVSSPSGDKSKHPMSKEKARAQQAAIYANWDGKEATDKTDEATGLPLNSDGTVTVYHHTSAANAAKIKATGVLKSAGEPDVYVTTEHSIDSEYGANGYGDTPVPLFVNPSILVLDDEFPDGRKDFRISVGKPGGSIKVKVGDIQQNKDVVTEMPAWNDGDKNIGNYMGKRHRMDVDSQYEKRGNKLEDFFSDNYQIRVYSNKLENELNYYVIFEYHEVAAFNWIKDGKFWKTVSAAVAPEHQGKGLAFKAYTHMIDKYMHTLSSDSTLTGETGGKGSFDLWVKLGKTYPFKYIYNREPSSRKLTKVDGFTRDMMEYDFERFIVSDRDLQEGNIRETDSINELYQHLCESYGIRTNKSGFSKEETEPATYEDKQKVKKIIDDKKLPETAEEGKAYVVQWADGRGVFACKTKKYLTKWLNDVGSWAEIVSIKYGEPKHGSTKLKIMKEMELKESLHQELTSIFFEGTIKVPTQEIEEWLKANLDDIIAKAKESAAQGYETYTDNNITVKNPYTNEPLDVSIIFRKKLSIPDNDTIDPVLYFDAKSATIYVNATLIFSLYKSKPSLYAGFLKSIIHELTHAIDPGRSHKTNDMGSYDEYVNNSVEFPAFANMYLNKLKNKIQSGKLQVNVLADSIRSGKKIPDIEVGGFMNKLNPENRTKFINYIYKELL